MAAWIVSRNESGPGLTVAMFFARDWLRKVGTRQEVGIGRESIAVCGLPTWLAFVDAASGSLQQYAENGPVDGCLRYRKAISKLRAGSAAFPISFASRCRITRTVRLGIVLATDAV
jgi:hypothetical protein